MNDSSHRDSPLGRYVGPVREVFSGDPRLGMAYIPMGRKLLGYLKNTLGAGGVEVGTHRLLLPDGARLAAHVDGFNHILHIDVRDVVGGLERELGIFVETGWINLVNLSGGEVPLTYSFLYYGARQYAALAVEFPKWLDEIILVVNEQNQMVRWREGVVRSPHAPTHPHYPPHDYIESPGFQTFQWVDAEGRLYTEYTRTQACTPSPGYATGKLKLYLQALLGGIGNPDFVLDEKGKTDPRSVQVVAAVRDIMGSYWADINPSIAFNWDFSRGLYTTDNYRYWLLSIVDRSVVAQEVILPYRYALLRRKVAPILKDDATAFSEKVKLETYLLSGGLSFGAAVTVNENLLVDLVGTPLHEGWKFNYRGDEAQIVTKEIVWEEYGESYRIKQHVFRRYKITLTYLPNNPEHPFSATIALEEEEIGTPEEKCLRPFRKPQSSGHILEWEDWHEWLMGPTRGYAAWIEFDAPLYCWYCLNELGEESFVTVRAVVKWPEATQDTQALLGQYMSASGPMVSCGATSSRHCNDILFSDTVGAKRGYYIRVESGPTTAVLPELQTALEDYTVFSELIEGRLDTVKRGENHEYAPSHFGGYMDLGFPVGSLTCDGSLAAFPPEMAGGTGVDITSEYGTYESYRHIQEGGTSFGHILVFPYNDGASVYLQRNQLKDGLVSIYYLYAWSDGFTWDGTAHFTDGHTAHHKVELAYTLGGWSSAVSSAYPPQYSDPRFAIEHPANSGIVYYSYSGVWAELRDRRRFYFSSAKNSELVFDKTATCRGPQLYRNYHFTPVPVWPYPADGIDTEACFGKHAWYVEISQEYFWPWFDRIVALNESYQGDAMYLQQWGPFEDHIPMPEEPIFNATDSHYPVFSSTDGLFPSAMQRQFTSIFVGWA